MGSEEIYRKYRCLFRNLTVKRKTAIRQEKDVRFKEGFGVFLFFVFIETGES